MKLSEGQESRQLLAAINRGDNLLESIYSRIDDPISARKRITETLLTIDSEADRWTGDVVVTIPKVAGADVRGQVISDMCEALAAVRFWRFESLVRSALDALRSGEFLAAALAGRALIETTAATTAESERLRGWVERESADETTRRTGALDVLTNALMGTRQSKLSESESVQRTNVMTLLDRASKAWGPSGDRVVEAFEYLSDVVHPSLESTGVYVQESNHSSSSMTLRLTAQPQPQEIGLRVFIAVAFPTRSFMFGIDTIVWAGRRMALADEAAPRPARNQFCPCGSGFKFKHCNHEQIDRWPSH